MRIRDAGDLERGARALIRLDPRLEPVLAQVGDLPLRLRPDGFPALLSAIVSQQLSTASAAAIWGRLTAAGLTDAVALRGADDQVLRATGLSRPKIRYARALAQADLNFAALRTLPTQAVVAELTQLPGIGRWTAEIYATFSLGHADAFAAGDLALQEATRLALALPARPGEAALRTIAADWAPWRAVAARALWAYYRLHKGREGVT
ncbi:MAG: DNA-3-methyladenine glycosylase 2 family protein [Rhodobacteraceae bacterium]|nr:DNA-3-methyladenine glycosylase 2 family protein [Paracoccaceae bacterium]